MHRSISGTFRRIRESTPGPGRRAPERPGAGTHRPRGPLCPPAPSPCLPGPLPLRASAAGPAGQRLQKRRRQNVIIGLIPWKLQVKSRLGLGAAPSPARLFGGIERPGQQGRRGEGAQAPWASSRGRWVRSPPPGLQGRDDAEPGEGRWDPSPSRPPTPPAQRPRPAPAPQPDGRAPLGPRSPDPCLPILRPRRPLVSSRAPPGIQGAGRRARGPGLLGAGAAPALALALSRPRGGEAPAVAASRPGRPAAPFAPLPRRLAARGSRVSPRLSPPPHLRPLPPAAPSLSLRARPPFVLGATVSAPRPGPSSPRCSPGAASERAEVARHPDAAHPPAPQPTAPARAKGVGTPTPTGSPRPGARRDPPGAARAPGPAVSAAGDYSDGCEGKAECFCV